MKQKIVADPQSQIELRKNLFDRQRANEFCHVKKSLQKKLSPVKADLKTVKLTGSVKKIKNCAQKSQENAQESKLSTQGSENCSTPEIMKDQDFMECYNNDPIFRCRVEKFLKEEQRKRSKGKMKVTKRASYQCINLDDEADELRTTLVSTRSQKQELYLKQVQNYKKLLKKQESENAF